MRVVRIKVPLSPAEKAAGVKESTEIHVVEFDDTGCLAIIDDPELNDLLMYEPLEIVRD